MNKKGFTLTELLAVIIVLSIILAVTVPGILKIIDLATSNAFEIDAKMVLKQIKYEQMKDQAFDMTIINSNNIQSLNISNKNYDEIKVGLVDNAPYIVIIGKNDWIGLKACGNINRMTVVPVSNTDACSSLPSTNFISSEGVNKPLMAAGMTPIKWINGVETVTTVDDVDWYNYANKEWANAKTSDGSYWVWIPRYAYQISSGYHTNTAGTINVKFLIESTNYASDGNKVSKEATYSNGVQTNYITHPAFTFGVTNLTGIWVSKFEASISDTSNECYTTPSSTSCNLDTFIPKMIPNVSGWRYAQIGNYFSAMRKMETNSTYGWGTTGTDIDTHMIKNVEWGAIAYLTQSTYGKNAEVWINNSNAFISGCGGNSASEAAFSGCQNAYNTGVGIQASTTGNIYGIYDISGGLSEYVASYINNNDDNLNAYSGSMLTADDKYKEVYTVTTDDALTNYENTSTIKGHALYETSSTNTVSGSWYQDNASMPRTDGPFIRRGGYSVDTNLAGTYTFTYSAGNAASYRGSRPVLLIGNGL